MYLLTTILSILSLFQREPPWLSSSAVGRTQLGLNPICVWRMCHTEFSPSRQVSSIIQFSRVYKSWFTSFVQMNMGETYYHLVTFFIASDLCCSIFPEILALSSAGYFVARAGLSWDRNNAEIHVSHIKELKQHGKTHETLKWQHFILFYNTISH